jgi:thiamine-monophosphate kinase
MSRLGDIGEDAIVKKLIAQLSDCCEKDRQLVVGPGDDCAVVDLDQADRYQLLKTDSMVEGIHYLAEASARKVGWKAVARVISDLAAMGGLPSHLLITIAMPPNKTVDYLEKLYEGMQFCALEYGATICGGETSSVPEGSAAVISVAATGWVEKNRCIRRCGGQVGDLIMVTGSLGGSITGKHLSFVPRVDQARWLTDHFKINSMMDLSDGLGCDLPRLAAASRCGYMLNESALPCNEGCSVDQALGDGEDYELLFTVSTQVAPTLADAWEKQFPDLKLSVIGELTKTQESMVGSEQGWQHFKPH